MTPEEVEACWHDPRNHKWGLFYYCKTDPRAVVPRGIKWMGWTLNFARLSAIPVALLSIAIVTVPVFIVDAKGAGTGIVLITEAVAITVLCLVCAYLSSRTD